MEIIKEKNKQRLEEVKVQTKAKVEKEKARVNADNEIFKQINADIFARMFCDLVRETINKEVWESIKKQTLEIIDTVGMEENPGLYHDFRKFYNNNKYSMLEAAKEYTLTKLPKP